MSSESWDDVEKREDLQMPTGVFTPPRAPDPPPRVAPSGEPATLIIVDKFDLTMIDINETGARVLIRPLSRSEALDLARAHRAGAVTFRDKDQSEIERELQLEPAPRPKLTGKTQLLVMQRGISWNDRRWFLVTYESDGEGVIE